MGVQDQKGGRWKRKVDIGSKKVDIGSEKVDIGSKKGGHWKRKKWTLKRRN